MYYAFCSYISVFSFLPTKLLKTSYICKSTCVFCVCSPPTLSLHHACQLTVNRTISFILLCAERISTLFLDNQSGDIQSEHISMADAYAFRTS